MISKKDAPKISRPAENFAEMIGGQFHEAFIKYDPFVVGIGQGYFFNNYIVITKLDQCMVRFVLDRNDIYIETAPKNTYPTTRPRNAKSLWFDVSITTSFLSGKDQPFKWFYPGSAYSKSEKAIQDQLSQLDNALKQYWEGIIDLCAGNFFVEHQEELQSFRDRRAQESWKLLGWDNKRNPPKPHRSVFGHFPEFAERATDLGDGNLYFGMDGKVWDTLWLKGDDSLFWAINKQFIDDAIDKRQDEIVLATEARNPESFYSREIKYAAGKLGM